MADPLNRLPDVGRIRGAIFEPGPTPKESSIEVQWSDRSEQWHALRMPFLDAMYLLNVLKGIQMDTDYQMPDDPRLYDPATGKRR
ncbi:MAG: hypothetical protein RLO21_21975 [Nitratireductor sp.]